MTPMLIPPAYRPPQSPLETEVAIKLLKDFFQNRLAKELNLTRVTAPLFVKKSSGLNDNLNGTERPVSFDASALQDEELEVVQSLAKWKRMALHRHGFKPGEGLYTDMNAIRRDEELSNIHSLYVDQWDWERVLTHKERSLETLKSLSSSIFRVFKETEDYVQECYPQFDPILPEEMTFISAQDLEDRFPELTPKEREHVIAREAGAVFIAQIGGALRSGKPHDGRAPDYDDWKLNGDIIFWYPVLGIALELTSMGIRVDSAALEAQLVLAGCEGRRQYEFHRMLLTEQLPLTVGGGIGQSRLCMFFLRKAHIGEVQSSIWPGWMIRECQEARVPLL